MRASVTYRSIGNHIMKARLCGWAGCSAIGSDGGYYCSRHRIIAEARKRQHTEEWKNSATRGKSAEYHGLYSTSAWRRRSRQFLEAHPYCARCGARATITDHIIPHRGNSDLFWDESNLQALCWSCHSIKTRQEQRQKR